MPKKIESTSSGTDRYFRRDFGTIDNRDKYGNEIIIDNAGNKVLAAKEDKDNGREFNFDYQKKYDLHVSNDKDGNRRYDASILDDAFIETLAQISSNLLEVGNFRVYKELSDGTTEGRTVDMDIKGKDNIKRILDAFRKYKDIDYSDEQEEPEINITILSLANKVEYTEEEQQFIINLADYMNLSVEEVLELIDNSKNFKVAKCNFCDTDIPDGGNFCPNCGHKKQVIVLCPSCKKAVSEGSHFCAFCGCKVGNTV
jgi:rRNA maturation endonuclease Nob1